jgi:glycolate oxidase
MPFGDEKHGLIYDELVNILGEGNVSDGQATLLAYSRDMFAVSLLRRKRGPEFVVLPGNTEDIQRIIQLANRYKFPFSVMSGGWMLPLMGAARPYWCIIDFKRMTGLEIDEKNMYAIIEPNVTHAQVQAEAMKVGLYNGVPLVGSHMSALANHAWHGWHGTAYRTGFSTRNILGMEWVLPTGGILFTGSLAAPSAGNFWGEGPGPDLKNLRKGVVGDNGSMGIITKMAIKLHPWPGPRFLPTEGVRPRKKCELPTNRFKWYFITYPTEKELIDAMYEIGKAEVGGNMERYDSQRLAYEYAKSRDEYWGLLIEGHWQQYPNTIAICLWGFASEKQLEYEEKVLRQIIDETGGKLWPEEVFQQFVPYVANTKIRSIWGPRWCRNGGSMQTGWLVMDSLDEVLSYTPTVWEHMRKYTPPYLEGHGDSAWVLPFDFCHFGGADNAPPFEKTEEIAKSVLAEAMEQMATDTKAGKTTFELATAPANMMGPSFSNFHRPLAKIKKAFDPSNVSNPTRFIDIAAMEREEKEKAESS